RKAEPCRDRRRKRDTLESRPRRHRLVSGHSQSAAKRDPGDGSHRQTAGRRRRRDSGGAHRDVESVCRSSRPRRNGGGGFSRPRPRVDRSARSSSRLALERLHMEIFPHVHQIRSGIADRDLFQYLFIGDNVLLLDTGTSTTPEEVILPYLRKIGISPNRLSLAVNTHADADHHGGNAPLRRFAENMLLACGDADRSVIENPDRLFALRYNHWMADHGVGLSLLPEASKWVREMAGPAHRIDITLRGGERIALDDARAVRVLHVPGHSNGHLAFYYDRHRAVFVGDALHGSYCPSAKGDPSLPPAYFSILAYLSTVQLIESLDVE